MSEAKEKGHTPLPWTMAYNDGSGTQYVTSKGENAVAALRWGCSCCEDKSPLTAEEIANARLIVAAVNSHENLLDAVKTLLSSAPSGDDMRLVFLIGSTGLTEKQIAFCEKLDKARQSARAALKEIEGANQ